MKEEIIDSQPVYEYTCEYCGKKSTNKSVIQRCEAFCKEFGDCVHKWEYDSFCDREDGNLNVDRTCSICKVNESKEIFPGNLPDELLEVIFGYLNMPEKDRCRNSMTGEHKWSEGYTRPLVCVNCGRVKEG